MISSSRGTFPSETNYERASMNNGLFPDLITYTREADGNLRRTYRIVVGSWEESSYSLVYYTQTKDGKVGIQKLAVGHA